MQDISEAKILSMLILSELEEVMEIGAAESALAAGGVEPMLLRSIITELAESKALECVSGYVSLTEKGREELECFEERKKHCRSNINRARRSYAAMAHGIDYRLSLEKAEGGSAVVFERVENGKQTFMTRLFFENAAEALEAYNYMDEFPDNVYGGFMTAATGKIKYL